MISRFSLLKNLFPIICLLVVVLLLLLLLLFCFVFVVFCFIRWVRSVAFLSHDNIHTMQQVAGLPCHRDTPRHGAIYNTTTVLCTDVIYLIFCCLFWFLAFHLFTVNFGSDANSTWLSAGDFNMHYMEEREKHSFLCVCFCFRVVLAGIGHSFVQSVHDEAFLFNGLCLHLAGFVFGKLCEFLWSLCTGRADAVFSCKLCLAIAEAIKALFPNRTVFLI